MCFKSEEYGINTYIYIYIAIYALDAELHIEHNPQLSFKYMYIMNLFLILKLFYTKTKVYLHTCEGDFQCFQSDYFLLRPMENYLPIKRQFLNPAEDVSFPSPGPQGDCVLLMINGAWYLIHYRPIEFPLERQDQSSTLQNRRGKSGVCIARDHMRW